MKKFLFQAYYAAIVEAVSYVSQCALKKDKLFSRNDFSNECGWFFMLLYGYPIALVDKNDYYAGDCFLADSFPCNKEYAIDLCAFRKAIKWADSHYGKGWRDNADSDTYDCILQMMAFGEVIYG